MRRGLVRGLVVLGSLAALWTIVVMWTGGGVWSIAGVRISSRGPRNATLLTAISVVLAWAFAAPGQRTHAVAVEYRWLIDRLASRVPRVPSAVPLVALLAAIIVAIVGLIEGAGVVGGSDWYGYVSQARLWTLGALRQRPQLASALENEVPLEVLSPLGYRPTVDGTTIASTYPPGLPLVMAVFEKLIGPASVFWVVPIFAAVLVWATYLLGARLHSPAVGATAAVTRGVESARADATHHRSNERRARGGLVDAGDGAGHDRPSPQCLWCRQCSRSRYPYAA